MTEKWKTRNGKPIDNKLLERIEKLDDKGVPRGHIMKIVNVDLPVLDTILGRKRLSEKYQMINKINKINEAQEKKSRLKDIIRKSNNFRTNLHLIMNTPAPFDEVLLKIAEDFFQKNISFLNFDEIGEIARKIKETKEKGIKDYQIKGYYIQDIEGDDDFELDDKPFSHKSNFSIKADDMNDYDYPRVDLKIV